MKLAGSAFHLFFTVPFLASSLPAWSDVAGLTLRQGDIFIDPVGSVMNVTVSNASTKTVPAVEVTCRFMTAGADAGTASAIIYNLTPGSSGEQRIQVMGVMADRAICALTELPGNTPAPAN